MPAREAERDQRSQKSKKRSRRKAVEVERRLGWIGGGGIVDTNMKACELSVWHCALPWEDTEAIPFKEERKPTPDPGSSDSWCLAIGLPSLRMMRITFL